MSSIDPLFWLRSIFASEKGTLMQLGVVPLLTADLLLHFCSLFDTSLVKLSEKENSLRRYNLKRGKNI
jgi:protein transport protein SEC61 subunit alpha